MNWDSLIAEAGRARERAYAPYSGFKVGSAVLTEDGSIHAGCNVENRSFGATICAERVAIGSAVAKGTQKLSAVVVITETRPPAPPCGLCLQVLTEFGEPDLPIMLVSTSGERVERRLADLHPQPFEIPVQGLGRLSQ
jgi:cytidine deaminase